MREAVKQLVRAVVPPKAVQTVKAARAAFATRDACEAFEHAPPGRRWLEPEMLPVLLRAYPRVPPYHYDPRSLWMRGATRRREVRRFLSGHSPRTLELACHDAMVSGMLARDGVRATAIDLTLDHVDPRARDRGVELVIADAEHLPFNDSRFDFVFSYNAFEHFGDPGAVLAESLRVVRRGGILYFAFGPLYRAAYGLHAGHSITVPFCQYLWERRALEDHVARAGLERIRFETLNEWSVQQFRDLWAEWRPWAEPIAYREIPDVRGMELVREHPSCFRHQTDRFEDLLVSDLNVGLRRTDKPFESGR